MPESATLVDAIAPSDITSTKRREPAQLFAELSVHIPSAKYAAGRIVFRQGDPADAVFLIGHGSLHRAIMTERGDDRLVAILGPGDFCGEDCLIHKQYRMTTAIVVADAEVIRIEKNLMQKLRLNCPRLADAFTSFLLTHSLETEAALIDQFVGSAEQRLGRVLLKLANVGDNDREPGVVLNVRQEMLAGLVGTTRPRINHFLTRFRRLGLIDYGGALGPGVIKVSPRLKQVCYRD